MGMAYCDDRNGSYFRGLSPRIVRQPVPTDTGRRVDLPAAIGDGTFSWRTLVYLQNWRGDVVGLIDQATGLLRESIRYSAYGRPLSIPAADYNGSGNVVGDTNDSITALRFH